MKTHSLSVRQGEYRGKPGWKLRGKASRDDAFPVSIFVRNETTARAIFALLRDGAPNAGARIDALIRDEVQS